MPSTPPQRSVPDGKITTFDRGHYDNLVKWLDGVDQDLNTNIAGPKAGVRLDATLGSGISPGSPNWPTAKALVDSATAFGSSVTARYTDLGTDWEQYVTALKNARDVFEHTSDL